MLTRVRVELRQSRFGQVFMVGTMLLACLLLLHLWPFSRPAVLIPVAWWAMYLVNRQRVSAPVLGLIDHAAEKAGFYPVPAQPGGKSAGLEEDIPKPAPVSGPGIEEDGEFPWRESSVSRLQIPMRFYLRAIAYFRDDLPLILASLVLIGLSTLAGLFSHFWRRS